LKFGSLQVQTPDGAAREIPLDLPSLIVGRADGNGIVIDDLSISRRHARIVIESGRLLIEDLGSAAGTFVGGHRIEPGSPNLVEGDQPIRFGDVQAHFTPAPPGTADQLDGDEEAAAEEAPATAITVTVTSPATPVEPGGAVFASAVIQNRGRVVDLVTLGISGVPSTWVTFSQQTLALVPGSRETITLVFQPPVGPESLAGEYDFGIVVNSGEHDRESLAFGKLTVTSFEATELHLLPIRSKRDFTLTAKNNGNALATYSLGGVDEEGNFLFDFEFPAIELQPGHERRVPFKVRRRKRSLFGKPSFAPFRVVATPTHAGAQVETPGQLLVRPPLERWKFPALLALLIGLLGLAFWLSWVYRDEIPTWIPWSTKGDVVAVSPGSPEAPYVGVHMCEKSPEERAREIATPVSGAGTGAPLFAQNNPSWGDDEYAKAGDPEFGPDWCGTTIEQCGCAMTSVATIMALFNILTMPDGSELTPQTVNAWFNGQARKTTRGWVSQGYIYGDVIWTAANELSGQIAKTRPGTPTIRFAGFGPGTEEEIRAELQAGRPMVIEVPGHYIAAVGLDGDKILINDPYYPDRRTLDAYAGKVKSSVRFEPSSNLSGVVITVPKDLRVRVLDAQGKVVGSLNTDEAGAPPPVGITGAYIASRNAWRDPSCVESPPPADAGTTSIFLPGNREDYRIEVLNPGGGGTSVAIHSYDEQGNSAVETRDSTGPSVVGVSFDPAQAAAVIQVIQGTTPGSGTGTQTPGGGTPAVPGGGGGTGTGVGTIIDNPTPTRTATPGVSPTATRTPVPTPAPIVPAAVTVNCDVAYTPSSAGVTCTGGVTGTYTSTRWSINGLPAPVPAGSTAFATTFTQNTSATIEMTACNVTVCKTGVKAVSVVFPTATVAPTNTPASGTPTPIPTVSPVGPPATVLVNCVYSGFGAGAQIDCSTTFSEAFTSITWTGTNISPTGVSGGSKQFTTFRAGAAQATVQATVCFQVTCTVSNVAVIPFSGVVGGIEIFAPDTVCVGTSVPWEASIRFTGWVPGDPNPTGEIATTQPGPYFGLFLPIQPGNGSLPPMASTTDMYAEGPGPFTITASYAGDANWPSAFATKQVTAIECGG